MVTCMRKSILGCFCFRALLHTPGRNLLLGMIFFSMTACAGVQYTDKIQAVDITQAGKKESAVQVLGNASEWRNSGVTLRKGVEYKISATGTWSAGPICGTTGPDGVGAASICTGGAATYMGKGSASLLIGKIGERGSLFPVGSGMELTADRDDVLFFRINDTPMWMGDNSGYVDVTTALPGAPVEKTNVFVVKKAEGQIPAVSGNENEKEKMPPLRRDAFAVVIGIDYSNRPDIPGLHYASQDARKVYQVLTDPRYGGVPKENAVLLLNEGATRNKMIEALRKIKTWDGYIYVYYSGHGAPEIREDKIVDGYLVPDDVVISDPGALNDTAIKMSYLQRLMDSSHAKGIMVALDACFEGGGKSILPKGGKPLVDVLETTHLLKPESSGKVILTASAPAQQAWEDGGKLKSGIFTYYLARGLEGKGSKGAWVKADELADYVKSRVSEAAMRLKGVEQTPQVIGEGDFAVLRKWEQAKVMDEDMARSRLKDAFEKGDITVEQLNKALNELKLRGHSKMLGAFLEGKINAKRFGELY